MTLASKLNCDLTSWLSSILIVDKLSDEIGRSVVWWLISFTYDSLRKVLNHLFTIRFNTFISFSLNVSTDIQLFKYVQSLTHLILLDYTQRLRTSSLTNKITENKMQDGKNWQ